MANLLRMAPLICTALFAGTLLLVEIGRRMGATRLAADPEGATAGVGAVETSVFALLGLLIVEEANHIGTAWLRLDLLPANDQPGLRELFRRYVDSRLETYRKLPDIEASEKELAHSAQLQQEIWREAVRASTDSGSHPTVMLLLQALNNMFDVRSTRVMASRMHPPAIVFVMLATLTLTAATLVGYDMGRGKSRNWLHIVGFAALMALTFYVILDLEYPRFGLIRVDAADQMLIELRESMQ